jgi:hypothetical protein
MSDQDGYGSSQDSSAAADEDVQIGLQGSAEEQIQFSVDDLTAVGYQPEPDSGDGQYNS